MSESHNNNYNSDGHKFVLVVKMIWEKTEIHINIVLNSSHPRYIIPGAFKERKFTKIAFTTEMHSL